MFYLNAQDLAAALINLDWRKVFDRISLKFMFKVMLKLGFSGKFISWINDTNIKIKSDIK